MSAKQKKPSSKKPVRAREQGAASRVSQGSRGQGLHGQGSGSQASRAEGLAGRRSGAQDQTPPRHVSMREAFRITASEVPSSERTNPWPLIIAVAVVLLAVLFIVVR